MRHNPDLDAAFLDAEGDVNSLHLPRPRRR
jgi:hypothetical protein